jgi:FtsP/CotA-like multicopper oxidase with cupredoxin domain
MVSRRELLKRGAVAVGLGAVGWRSRRAAAQAAADLGLPVGQTSPSSPPVSAFGVPLPRPDPLVGVPAFDTMCPTDASTQYYQIRMREATREIIPGLPTPIWGYQGLYPGPPIVARTGRSVVVRQHNELPENVVVHLHGGHNPPDSDGFPTDYILPGASRDFCYPNTEAAATHWYHDHTMDFTGWNVVRGLAGFYLITDDLEAGLNLPSGDFDVPLMFQDRRFNPDGSFFYDPLDHNGYLGDRFLVNGAIQPFFQVSRRKYRFRMLNASNARFYHFFLSTGQPFVQIATEGGLMAAPVTRASIPLAPAERVEVVLDFSVYPAGTQVSLENCLVQTSGLGPGRVDRRQCTPILRFDVGGAAVVDPSAIPRVLRPSVPLPQAVATRNFSLDVSQGVWRLNGLAFDPGRTDVTTRLGTSEIWRFVNPSGSWAHPMHIHHDDLQIIERNGRPPALAEIGFKDTVSILPGETVSVLMPFSKVGRYVFHCHNLEHEDMRMMSVFEVTP